MAFNFGDEEESTNLDGLDTGEEDIQDTISELTGEVQAVEESPEVEAADAEDIELNDVDERLTVAQYYNTFLKSDLFEDDNSPAAQRVTTEIQAFIRGRLRVLMGLKAEAPVQVAKPTTLQDLFSASQLETLSGLLALSKLEVEAVKKVGSAILDRERAKEKEKPAKKEKEVKAEPQLKKATPPPAVQPAPEPTKQAPKAKPAQQPQLKKAQVPASVQQKPVQAVKQPPRTATVPKSIPRPGAKTPASDPRVPEEYRNDPTLRIVGMKIEVARRNEDGSLATNTLGQILYKDITPVARPQGVAPLPMPDTAGWNQAMAVSAQNNLNKMGGTGNSLFGRAMAGSLAQAPKPTYDPRNGGFDGGGGDERP